ncbi:MAG: Hsp70 family protein [Defluviitaleaceae bacterium]|nr:Hsp70 family protein [Defluviitaleaceae bacterium]
MSKVYGIDLGTTYSAIATLDDNAMPQIIENQDDGIPLLASAVYFQEGGAPVIGEQAKSQSEVESHRVVQYVKREIGKENFQTYTFDGVTYDPIAISSLILKRMAEYVQEQGEGEVRDVVITCPADFGIDERNATRQAGEAAGLNVLSIVDEPTAAALNYCSREFKESRKIMVYDLGGGTFDVTLFDFAVDEEGHANIVEIARGGDARLGGIDWDAKLYDYICELYTEEHGIALEDLDLEMRQTIRNLAEKTKKDISTLKSKNIDVGYGADRTRLAITQEKFEELTTGLVDRTLAYVQNLMSSVGVTQNDIDTVLLVGGSTKMPMIKAAVEGMFPGKVRVEQPDFAVAKGAAISAAITFNKIVQEVTEKAKEIIEEGGSSKELEVLIDGHEDLIYGALNISKEEGATVEDLVQSVSNADTSDLLMNVPGGLDSGEINVQIPRSFGVATWADTRMGEEYVISNMLFIGDTSPAEITQTYYTRADNAPAVRAPIYENVATDKDYPFVTTTHDHEGNERIPGPDPSLRVKSLGQVVLSLPPNTPKGSPIEVQMCVSVNGLDIQMKNPLTGEMQPGNFQSSATLSRAELDALKLQMSQTKTSGQIN